MCNRIAAIADDEIRAALYREFEIYGDHLSARYNIPVRGKEGVQVVSLDETDRPRLSAMRWGFVPHYDNAPKPQVDPTNGRAASAFARPIYRDAVQRRRCLVPVDGFYEFMDVADGKQGFLFQLPDRRPFYLPGIYEKAHGPWPDSFLFFTVEPNALVAPMHDRMPVIHDVREAKDWLVPGAISAEQFKALMIQLPSEALTARPVSRFVNSVKNEGARCIEPPLEASPAPTQVRAVQSELF